MKFIKQTIALSFTLALISSLAEAQARSLKLKEIKTKNWNELDDLLNGDNYVDHDVQYETKSLTISGFSTGGYMTANLVSMFNTQIKAAGIFAGGGPCAQASLFCKRAPSGEQYTTAGLSDMPVLVFHGTQDDVVDFNNATVTADWFEDKGSSVKRLFIDDFLHVIPSNTKHIDYYNPSESCAYRDNDLRSCFNCGYNLAKMTFNYLLGGVREPIGTDDYQDYGQFFMIDQRPYHKNASLLSDFGFLYVPNACQRASCDIHVHFHGCVRSAVDWNDTYARGTGMMQMAAKNDVIVLFPQNNDTLLDVFEPYHFCWSSAVQDDWKHPQIQGVVDLIQAVSGVDLAIDLKRNQEYFKQMWQSQGRFLQNSVDGDQNVESEEDMAPPKQESSSSDDSSGWLSTQGFMDNLRNLLQI